MDEGLKKVILDSKSNYKCFDFLKKLLSSNDNIKKIIIEGINTGKISGFDADIWNKIETQNIRRINSFDDVFRDGCNIGYCTVAAKQLSYSLDNIYLCGGVVAILKNSPNSVDGSHTWIVQNNKVIDTTLMLIIDEDYSKKLGYVEENRYDPNLDEIYLATKEFTLDKSLKK